MDGQNAIEGTVVDQGAPKVGGLIELKLDLPSGGWVEFRDPTELRAKDRKAKLGNVDPQGALMVAALDMSSALGMLLVLRFGGIPYPPFSGGTFIEMTPALIEELTLPDYDALVTHVEPAMKLLFPGKATVDDRRPGSPTPPDAG